MKICIDAGHGDFTAGKRVPSYMGVGNISEWELNNRVTIEQIKLLEQYENVQILRLDDPTGKRDVPLIERTNKANKWNADILISNHHNAGINGGKGGGLVLYRYPNSNKFTKSMQKALYDEMIKAGAIKGNRSNPLAEANFHMVRESNMPAILIEHAFMDSKTDIKEILKDDFAIRMAKGVVEFLEKHFKLKKKPKPKPKGKLYRVQAGAFKNKDNALNLEKRLERDKYNTYLVKDKGLYKVQVGAFENKGNADRLARELKAKGYDTYITTEGGQAVVEKPKPKPKPKVKLAVDGYWGAETTRALQRYLGTTVDGVISGQYPNGITRAIPSADFTTRTGSMVIRALQKKIGAKVDGYIGPDTVRALQRHLGTIVDGQISKPSMMVKELQKRLNNGTF